MDIIYYHPTTNRTPDKCVGELLTSSNLLLAEGYNELPCPRVTVTRSTRFVYLLRINSSVLTV